MEETKKTFDPTKFQEWLKKYLWLFAVAFGLMIFFGWCGPILSTHEVSASLVGTGKDAKYVFAETSDRIGVYLPDLFAGNVWCYPILLTYLAVVVAIVFTFFGKKWNNFYIVSLFIFLCAGIIFFTGNNLYDFTSCSSLIGTEATGDWGYIKNFSAVASTKLGFGMTWSGIFSFVAASFCLGAANAKDSLSVADMTEIGVLSAMAIGLQFIRIPVAVGPGSINLGLIPLYIISLRQGPTKGFLAGAFIYGIVTCLTDGYGFFTYPLDYLVGFGSVAILGFFTRFIFTKDERGWNWYGFLFLAIGLVLCSFVRFVGSSASSMLNYGYSFQAALAYNAIYIPVTGAVSYAALAVLYIPLAKLQKFFPARSVSEINAKNSHIAA